MKDKKKSKSRAKQNNGQNQTANIHNEFLYYLLFLLGIFCIYLHTIDTLDS